MKTIGFVTMLLMAVAGPAASSEAIISDPERPVWGSYGDIKVSRIVEGGLPGRTAVRIAVPRAGVNFWDSSATGNLIKPIEKGQLVTIGFFARSGDADKGAWVNAVVGRTDPPYAAAAVARVDLDREMRFYCVEGVSPVNVPKGKGRLTLHVAGAEQVIDLGPYMVTMRGPSSSGGLPCHRIIASTASAGD